MRVPQDNARKMLAIYKAVPQKCTGEGTEGRVQTRPLTFSRLPGTRRRSPPAQTPAWCPKNAHRVQSERCQCRHDNHARGRVRPGAADTADTACWQAFLYNSSAQTCSSAPDPPLHSMANAAPRRRPTSEPKPMHRVPVHSSCSAAAARTMKRRLVRDRSLYGHEGVQRPQRWNDGNNAQWQVGVGRCQIRTLLSTTDPVRAPTCEHATWRSDRSSKVHAPTWGRL